MNRDKIIALLEDGASFDRKAMQFVHPSFRKGFRKLRTSDISWVAVERVHGTCGTKRLTETNGVYRLAAA